MMARLVERLPGRLPDFARLVRLDKPIGIYLLLWPPLWALWIAGDGRPDPLVVAVFVAGVILMRSAGCAINDYADRHFDGHVARTQARMIPAGRIRPREAVVAFAVLSLCAFALVLLMNWLTIGLSLIGLALAAVYPYSKRHTYLPQVVLGAAFGWAVPMAFAAQTGTVPALGWLMYVTAILWATAYDTMYAMVDRKDDLKIGIKSTAILFGELDKLIIGILQALVLGALFLIGQQAKLGGFYYMGLTVAAGLAIYEQWMIREREPAACFRAFLHNNWFGLVVFCGVVLDFWARGRVGV
ncbi:MAG: 4-hydroxybenzoate octaprenyltransferase [Proteobacteria bacterium]|nr:MAG: 4-hydroxybenzoate octaprenyltransferase [Pseudomonadota bacterium]